MKNVNLLLALVMCAWAGCKTMDAELGVSAGLDALKAITLSDKEVKEMSRDFIVYSDTKNKVASTNSTYGKRLARLTKNHQTEDGLGLNFKVYTSDQVNAFATADGSVRFNSGLMDLMTDDEIRSVLGHEIGHVKLQHSKKQMKLAYLTSAARKGVAAQGGQLGALATSELGTLGALLTNTKLSRKEETESDDYRLRFLTRHGYNRQAAVTSLEKLAEIAGGGRLSFLSSHPDPKKRAENIRRKL
ncbi:MAG: M48 family metalloprotease [Kiritimatiellae bacterium]|nr:M48 family metalloprotease [Kiritimatiellia bacterium]